MNNNLKATAMDSVVELSPKIRRARSTFNLGIREYTSFNIGELVPLGGFTEVLPGDTFNVNLNTFIRITSPSKRPPMDSLHMDVFAFFVPLRFLDASWVNIQGENPQAWVAPAASCSVLSLSSAGIQAGSLMDHLGFPIINPITADVNIYPIYGYMKICNDWFRDENLQNEIAFDNTNNTYTLATIPTINSNQVSSKGSLFKVAKYHDVFTSALPAPQKSAAQVTIPLGTQAPVMASTTTHTLGNYLQFGTYSDHSNVTSPIYLSYGPSPASSGYAYIDGNATDSIGSPDQILRSNLYADLGNASAASINSLRLAFQLQKAYELDARSGTRYTEALEARFGTKNPDLRLGRSELLGHYRFTLNMSELYSTTEKGDASISDQNLLGDAYVNGVGAGASKTGNSQHICVKSFTEHGLFMILGCVRSDLTYQQGLEKYWLKKDRWSFYEPIFSNIGEVPIMKSELFAGALANDSVFGYQEAWYEYRYKTTKQTSGILNSDSNSAFDIFHYGQDFASAPTLSSTFIQQDSAALDRTLMLGSATVDQFICQVEGVIKATRVMPLFSTPGLIDHF